MCTAEHLSVKKKQYRTFSKVTVVKTETSVGISTLATALLVWEFCILCKVRFSLKLTTVIYFKAFRVITRMYRNAEVSRRLLRT
jgi:hypothetical protein